MKAHKNNPDICVSRRQHPKAVIFMHNADKKAVLSQRWPRDARYI